MGYAIVNYLLHPAPPGMWHLSMQRGDGQAAIYWARKMIDNNNPALYKDSKNLDDSLLPVDYGMSSSSMIYLSRAYELSGEYDLALKRYQLTPQGNALDIARVLYKMERLSESFEAYCDYCKREIEKREGLNGVKALKEEYLYDRIMCHNILGDNSRKFRPFATFHDFYAFMNDEYVKHGRPSQYAQVMELFRRVNSNADGFMADAERFLSDHHE